MQNTGINGELNKVNNSSSVGRLKSYISKWKSVSDNNYIINVVGEGYKLHFQQTPKKKLFEKQ